MTRALLIVALAGCTETVQLDTHLAGVVSLDIAPHDATLAVSDPSAPAQTLAYTATGTFDDGTTRDVTPYVTWSVDNPLPGSVSAAGTYATSNAAGGHVVVTAAATDAPVSATATLAVIVSATIVDATFPPPGDPATLFPPGTPLTDPMRSPAVLYPADGTAFPQGVARTLVQYARGMQNDAWRLAFDNDVLHLVVYTGSDRWSADGALWQLIAQSGIDAPVVLAVEAALSTAPGPVYTSAPVQLVFSRDAPAGAIAYWSAATSGVMRGSLGAVTASKMYPGDATCVGCHAISRDGRAMALGYGGETLQEVTLPGLSTVIDAGAKIPMGWATFSPDGTKVLVADKGTLTLLDAATGMPVGSPDGKVHLPPMTFATHPDWSPDGNHVAVAITAMAPSNMDVNHASIAVLHWDGHMLGMPTMLVPTMGMDNAYFPRWSPDGKYLAFVHAVQTARDAMSADLELVAASGGAPIALARANAANAEDVMPVWAPAGGNLAWLAFASARAYGAVMPGMTHGQIWIAALDLTLDPPRDPSYPAFWLPCQDVTVLNNNPTWTPAADTTQNWK